MGAAIEIVDVDVAPDELEEVLAGDIFQRHVIAGEPDVGRAGGDARGITVSFSRGPDEIGFTEDPTALTGELVALTAHVASWLGVCGQRLRAGQFIICGSTIPLVPVNAGEGFVFRCEPLGELTVSFAP